MSESANDDVWPEPTPPLVLPAGLDPVAMQAALEAVLLVVDEPVPVAALASALERDAVEVASALEGLAAAYDAEGRGFELRQVAHGWRLYTRAAYAPFVERFVMDGQQARLTQAALETLAVIAYRQPVSRSKIAAIRGVNVDAVVRTLVARGLVDAAGVEDSSGAHLYRTTPYFLERLGLSSLEDLPDISLYLPDASKLDEFDDQPFS